VHGLRISRYAGLSSGHTLLGRQGAPCAACLVVGHTHLVSYHVLEPCDRRPKRTGLALLALCLEAPGEPRELTPKCV